MTEQIKGLIEAVSNKIKGRYSLKIGKDWYSGFGSTEANKGDEVEIEFQENKGFLNIKKITVLKKGIKEKPIEENEIYARQTALNNSVGFWETLKFPDKTTREEAMRLIKETANELLTWLKEGK